MLFNSYLFIFVFLPIVLFGWYGLHKLKLEKTAKLFLFGMSLWFYGYFHVEYLMIILCSIAFNYGVSALLTRVSSDNLRQLVKWSAVFCNLLCLGYFKYVDFFIENFNQLFHTDFLPLGVLLPLGISFFTFQQLSFVIDRANQKAPHYDFLDYCCFVTFFPQLIAGPIVLHQELVWQFGDPKKKRFSMDALMQGIRYFVTGLAKKILLADAFLAPIEYGFTHITGLDTVSALAVALSFTLELYFDFSGYCDMAIGIGKMFQIELPDNFLSPYKSTSVKEFWNRWHMTLGRFFTTYVYIPLGGNRHGKCRCIVNTMIVFLLSGLWHGANWTFVFWGMLHGIAVSINSLFIRKKETLIDNEKAKSKKAKLVVFAKRVLTFSYVCLAFVFFRADTLKDGFLFMKQLFTPCYSGRIFQVAETLSLPETYLFLKILSLKTPSLVPYGNLVCYFGLLMLGIFFLCKKNARERYEGKGFEKKQTIGLAILFVWCVLSLTGVSTFLYFNF